MAHIEAPARLSDAFEAFKADLSVSLKSSGALAALKECLKQRLYKGHSSCPVGSRHEGPRQDLAHSIIAEHLEGTAGLKYTLPVFLSETCQSRRTALPLTAESLCKQLGISEHSPVGSFLAAGAPAQAPDASASEEATLLLSLLKAVQALHGGASRPDANQHLQVAARESASASKQNTESHAPEHAQAGAAPAREEAPPAQEAQQSKAALALVRALRIELHTSQRLCGVLLRELLVCDVSDAPVPGLPPLRTRIASFQATLLSQQRRAARLEEEEEAQLQRIEPLRHCGVQLTGMNLPCFCPAQSPGSHTGSLATSHATSQGAGSSTCPGCLAESRQPVRHACPDPPRPLQMPATAPGSTCSRAGTPRVPSSLAGSPASVAGSAQATADADCIAERGSCGLGTPRAAPSRAEALAAVLLGAAEAEDVASEASAEPEGMSAKVAAGADLHDSRSISGTSNARVQQKDAELYHITAATESISGTNHETAGWASALAEMRHAPARLQQAQHRSSTPSPQEEQQRPSYRQAWLEQQVAERSDHESQHTAGSAAPTQQEPLLQPWRIAAQPQATSVLLHEDYEGASGVGAQNLSRPDGRDAPDALPASPFSRVAHQSLGLVQQAAAFSPPQAAAWTGRCSLGGQAEPPQPVAFADSASVEEPGRHVSVINSGQDVADQVREDDGLRDGSNSSITAKEGLRWHINAAGQAKEGARLDRLESHVGSKAFDTDEAEVGAALAREDADVSNQGQSISQAEDALRNETQFTGQEDISKGGHRKCQVEDALTWHSNATGQGKQQAGSDRLNTDVCFATSDDISGLSHSQSQKNDEPTWHSSVSSRGEQQAAPGRLNTDISSAAVSGDIVNAPHSHSQQEDELSSRMRRFLAGLKGGTAAPSEAVSVGATSAFSVQAAQGSTADGELHPEKVAEDLEAEVGQPPSSGRVSWESQVKCDATHSQDPGEAQAGTAPVSTGHSEGPMPGPAWAASTFALCDASCTVSTASALLRAPASHDAGRATQAAADSSTELSPAHDKALEGLPSKAGTSMSPAYSMLPWDQIGPWPADCASMCSTEGRAASGAAAAVHNATSSSGATPAVHLTPTSSRTATAVHDTPSSSSAAPAVHETLSSALPSAADADMHWQAGVIIPGLIQRQHGSAPKLLAVSRSQPGSLAVQPDKGLGFRSPLHTDTSASHGSTGYCQASRARHMRVYMGVNSSSAAGSIEGISGLGEGRAPVSGECMSRAWPHQLPSTGDVTSLAASSGQQPAAEHTPGQTLGSKTAMAQPPAMAVWDRSQTVLMRRSLVADASSHTGQNWLQGYSDATVHISAALPKVGLTSVSAAVGKRSDTAASMPVSQKAATSAINSLPGATQQQLSCPFSLSLTSVKTQASSLMHKEVSAAPRSGLHAGPVSPETPRNDSVRSSSDATMSAQSSAQKPVKGQDVAVDRTMPSIWDLDM